MPHRITIGDLFASLRERLKLVWLAGEEGRDRTLIAPGERPGSSIVAGPLNYIHPNRVQMIGRAEQAYLGTLSETDYRRQLDRLFQPRPAAIVVVDELEPDAGLLAAAERSGTPLLQSPMSDNQVLDNLQYFASLALADTKTLHGVFLEVLGMGVLITGEAAVGKSELALDLIARGARLIADDAPAFSRIAPDIISGTCPPVLRDFLEVRGLGVLDIRALFGDSSIKRTKYLRLVMHLQHMNDEQIAAMDRLRGSQSSLRILDVVIPQIIVPVAPGRNLAVLVESAVRNHLLKLKGYDAAEAFIERQQKLIQENTKA